MAGIVGLLVDVHFTSGMRAGGLNPENPGLLMGAGWQDADNGKEVWIVKDGDTAPYRGIEGIEILGGEAAIDAAIESVQDNTPDDDPSQFFIANETLLGRFIDQAKVDIRGLVPSQPETWAKALYDVGCVGVVRKQRRIPSKCKDIAEAHGIIGERFKKKIKER